MQAQVPADPYFGLWSRRPEDAARRKAALAVKGEALLRFATDAETHDVEFVHTD